MTGDFEAAVAGAAALNDPTRRSLYLHVSRSTEPVSRDQAAGAVGVDRSVAAFHLDKLADEGLLEFEFRRLSGRTGPGAGRPAKLYRRSARQIDLSLPPRQYDLAGLLLAEAIEGSAASGRSVHEELERASTTLGMSLGREALSRSDADASTEQRRADALDVLRANGFEPRVSGDEVILANCPFHALAQEFTDLVCGMNLHLMTGFHSVLALGDEDLTPRLDPGPGRCCVKLCGGPVN